MTQDKCIAATVTNESVTVAGRTVPHNEYVWGIKTNRHTTTGGYDWGWIDGAPGNICWEDGERFDRAAASEMARAHNRWLEDQKPLPIKIIQAKRRLKEAEGTLSIATKTFEAAQDKYFQAESALDDLLVLSGDHP